MTRFNEQVYSIVDKTPCGKVMSYGQIAWMLGRPRCARLIGRAMRYCPEGLPWQRVVRTDGSIADGGHPEIRRALLDAEGVPFLSDGRVDMKSCLWNSEDQ